MWLINVDTLKLENFFDTQIPSYAILSHTWEEEEVTFDEWRWPDVDRLREKKGYLKVINAIRSIPACWAGNRSERLKYIWVDTVCIDKRSSAELSEAINSMFRWYKKASVCFVYLSDVRPAKSRTGAFLNDLARSRWFTRGWTLQELLAPRNIVFLSQNWTALPAHNSLIPDLGEITRIPERLLMREVTIKNFCVAQRMSWASRRNTTRSEDMAYCLMGLFDVNMPLLYGEGGRKAFRRLQAEIISNSIDHSILAWSHDNGAVLAPSPQSFHCREENLHPFSAYQPSHYMLTNAGLQISLPILRLSDPDYIIAVLDCRSGLGAISLGLLMHRSERERQNHVHCLIVMRVDVIFEVPSTIPTDMYIHDRDLHRDSLDPANSIMQILRNASETKVACLAFNVDAPSDQWLMEPFVPNYHGEWETTDDLELRTFPLLNLLETSLGTGRDIRIGVFRLTKDLGPWFAITYEEQHRPLMDVYTVYLLSESEVPASNYETALNQGIKLRKLTQGIKFSRDPRFGKFRPEEFCYSINWPWAGRGGELPLITIWKRGWRL